MRCSFLVLAIGLTTVARAPAHYHILLPDRNSVKVGDKVTLTYVFGHPFEHDLFDTEKPTKATLYAPDGKATDALAELQKVETAGHGGKRIVAYQLVVQPDTRGDHTVVFESPPVWMADDKHFLRDLVRVTIHVETQKGWDARLGEATRFSAVPLTRPYGLRAGTVFQAIVYPQEPTGVSHTVEVERFNSEPPAALPPDEHITLALKTDPLGTATCTLPDPGWWGVTAIRRHPAEAKTPTQERDGKAYPLVERSTLWVMVDGQVALRPAE
jgi:cobalt/nickel transport protein